MRTKEQRNVLMIAFYFAPALTGGVFRPLKFAKYLADFGWNPIILKSSKLNFLDSDYNLLQELRNDISIINVPFLSPMELSKWLKNFLHLNFTSDNKIEKDKKTINSSTKIDSQSIFSKLLNTLLIPDPQIIWLPFAVIKAFFLIKKYSIPIVISTSPPNSSHLISLILKKMARIKVITDFRDPWFSHWKEFQDGIYLSNTRKKIENKLLSEIVKQSDFIINIGKGESEELKKEVSNNSSEKFHIITNGYDISDFPTKIQQDDRQPKFTICHLGYLYKNTADFFFEALFKLLEINGNFKNNTEIRFVGHIDSQYYNLINSSIYADNFKLYGPVSHLEAIRIACQSDILLICLGGFTFKSSEIPGKVFEYLAAKKFIMMIGPTTGDTAKIIKNSGHGVVLPDNKEKIFESLNSSFKQKIEKGEISIKSKDEYIAKYDRKYLTSQLAELLNELY